jgi:medium-chain acyl-[acyl-carrier-protein] hydrolase
MSRICSVAYDVHTYELDPRQQLSIKGVCGFMIDAAGHNAHELGFSITQLLEHNRTWFLNRFLLRIREYPGWRQKITVQTWPSGTQRLLALRDWHLFCGRRLIGAATSGWLMIDNRSRRPLRSESYADWRSLVHPQRAIAHSFAKLPALQEGRGPSAEPEFVVRYGDVDINNHANYLSYIDWILESIPPEVRSGGDLAEMEIHFLLEANFADAVVSRSQELGPTDIAPLAGMQAAAQSGTGFLHSLTRSRDSAELARARTVWKPAVRPGG